MDIKLQKILESCLKELYFLYHKYQNAAPEKAREESSAIKLIEESLTGFQNSEQVPQNYGEINRHTSQWEGENRRAEHGDRRAPKDRRRMTAHGRRRR